MHKCKETDRLFAAILSLKSTEECYALFSDMCTVKEVQAMSQRLEVASQLASGKNYNAVSEDTGASSATISRVNRCLQYGEGGYRLVLSRLEEEECC